ncbi:MAG: hypothetical protein Q9N68_10130 [Gammaproteobacteria bacterium]|nr:hypothetical protein [Gammaproteobacteria bacterium]
MNRSLLSAATCALLLGVSPLCAQTTLQNKNSLNPAISLILNGRYFHNDVSTDAYRLDGFLANPDAGLGSQGLSLGESELTMSANVDPRFFAQTTLSFDGDPEAAGAGVEEAFVQTLGLGSGLNVKMGRFFSAMGYLNEQHAHAWDFSDAPLVYRALFGNQLQVDGLQVSALLPTDRFMQLGVEASSGSHFPASGVNNGVGAWSLFYNIGDDWGLSHSWQLGLNYWQADSVMDRQSVGLQSDLLFSGKSRIGSLDFVYKWAPNGNPINQNFKLQFEYFDRHEEGNLQVMQAASDYRGEQRGWYLEGLYQWNPQWTVGVRYDRLSSDNRGSNGALLAREAIVSQQQPQRYSLMLSWAGSEFSHIRMQYNRDDSYQQGDNQLFLHYIVSVGSHGAHQY